MDDFPPLLFGLPNDFGFSIATEQAIQRLSLIWNKASSKVQSLLKFSRNEFVEVKSFPK